MRYGSIAGVTPVGREALPAAGSAATLPAPASSGAAAADPDVANRAAEAEYGGAPAATDGMLVSSVTCSTGPEGIAALTAGVVVEDPLVVGALFIEVGPISVVLNGVSPLLGAGGAIAAPGFSAPGPTTGAP